MDRLAFGRTAFTVAVLVTAAGSSSVAQAGDRPSKPVHYSGLLNDYTPSAAVVKGGPYEMRGKWSLDVARGGDTATFDAAMNMETSDYGIVQATVDKDDPTTRGAHTHHISMTDGVVTDDWATKCPVFSPAALGGFVVTGTATITGNGSPAPFGNPTPLTICVLGGSNVTFSNVTLTFGMPANTHFGTQPIHGVVLNCVGPGGRKLSECTLEVQPPTG